MIKVIAVGKLKENYLKQMVEDYKKRISKYHKIEIIEIKDSNPLEESKLIKKHLSTNSHIIALAIDGVSLSTLELKEHIIKKLSEQGNITFIIGGSNGLDESIYSQAHEKISFSRLTYPHALFRAILLEQIYRIFKIENNETYHK